MKTAIIGLACLAVFAWAQERFTPEQLRAKFYYDLGPAQVDVSAYPLEQQRNYARLKETCSQCHTLARAINAPFIRRKEWKKYVERMHLISKEWPQTKVTEQDAKDILDFLAFDSHKRKVENAKAFQNQAEALKSLFKQVEEERLRIQSTEGKSAIPAQPRK